MRNSVLGLWSLRSGDRVAKPGRLVVFLSCGGEGCECQSQPTGAPRDSGTSSPRRGHPFGTADASHLRSHLGIPGMSPMLRSPEPSPVGSQCLPKAGSGSASALDGHLAGWVPAPLGQFLPQLISSLWPMPGSEPSLAEHAARVVSARQACFCCWHWPHFPGTLPGGAPSLTEFSWEPAGGLSRQYGTQSFPWISPLTLFWCLQGVLLFPKHFHTVSHQMFGSPSKSEWCP